MSGKRPAHSTSAAQELAKLKAQIEALYVRADPRSVDDPELASDLARYLCLRVAGYLEQAMSVCIRDRCLKGSWGIAQSFAMSWTDRMPNMSADAYVKVVGRFGPALASGANDVLAEDERRATLNSLIGIRNDIAHGKNQGISREQAWEYFKVVEVLADWFAGQISSEVSV